MRLLNLITLFVSLLAVSCASRPASVSAPAVASNGSDFLIAYLESTAGEIGLATVTATGVATAGPSAGSARYGGPALAASGSTYLVSWPFNSDGRSGPFLRGVDAHGQPVGAAQVLTGKQPQSLSLAGGSRGVVGAWLSPRTTPEAGSVVVASGLAADGSQLGTSTMLDPKAFGLTAALAAGADSWLAAWSRGDNGQIGSADSLSIVATRLDAAGHPLDAAPVVLAADATYPGIAIGAGASGWLVVWYTIDAFITSIDGAWVTADGKAAPLGKFVIDSDVKPKMLAVSAIGDRFLVVWSETAPTPPPNAGTTGRVQGRFMRFGGAPDDRLLIEDGAATGTSLAMASNATEYLVAWTAVNAAPDAGAPMTSSGSHLRVARVSAAGTLLDPAGIDVP